MKITVTKCERDGALFEHESDYQTHMGAHETADALNKRFPPVEDDHLDFANGGYCVQRSKEWSDQYLTAVTRAVKKHEPEIAKSYKPLTYGWYRSLDEGGSFLYGFATRLTCVCLTCYREWGQTYHANHCNHDGTFNRK